MIPTNPSGLLDILEVDSTRIRGGLEDWGSVGGGLEGGLEEECGCSKWLEIVKNYVLRFLPFYPLISVFQAFSCIPHDRP